MWDAERGQIGVAHLADGSVTVFELTLPGGDQPESSHVIASNHFPEVLIFGKGSGGRTFFQRWKVGDPPVVELDEPLPFWPSCHTSWDGTVEVMTEFGPPITSTEDENVPCTRASFSASTGGFVCRSKVEGIPLAAYMSQGWTYHEGQIVRHGRDVQRWPINIQECRGAPSTVTIYARVASPPRAALSCRPRGQDETTIVLWRPERMRTVKLDRGQEVYGVFMTSTDQHIIGVGAHGQSGETAFISLERELLLETELLHRLSLRIRKLSNDRFLAERRPENARELVLVDLAQKTVRLVARYTDCQDGELEQILDERSGRVAIGCYRQRTSAPFAELLWAEIIDLSNERRWRVTDAPELILDDGTIVASDQRSRAEEMVVTARQVFVVELE